MPARARQEQAQGRKRGSLPSKAPLQYFDVYHGCDFSITVRYSIKSMHPKPAAVTPVES